MALDPLLRSRAQRWGAGVVALVLGGAGFLPLFGGPGYEAALAAGLVLPVVAAVATAVEVARARPEPFDAVGRGAASGFGFGLLALLAMLVHGLRVGFCDALSGLLLFGLGAWVGAVMGGVWGGIMGLFAPRPKRRWLGVLGTLALALLGPLSGVLGSLWRFWSSPMVFAYDPFFGYFAGPLYDTVIDALVPLATYRIGSVATLLAVVVAALHLERRGGGYRLVQRGRPGVLLVGIFAAVGSLVHVAMGPELGHWQTQASITAELERELSSKRCDVVYSAKIRERDAQLLARECDGHVKQIEAWLGAAGPERIRVYLFADGQQKQRLMGARYTYIAKPWRQEVYVQRASFPHPVLGHELAHVVVGHVARGPFRVAGPLGGWLPDPGRIEGVATAAAPSEDAALTLQQWSRAMQELELLPELDAVFRLSFFGENSSTAYTVAGAFVQWLHDTHGSAAVRGWYAGVDLQTLTGKSFGDLAAAWRKSLDGVEVDAEAMHAARVRFDRPAIFGRVCPHEVDGLHEEASERLAYDDWRGAAQRWQKLLELDPSHFQARMGLGTCAVRAAREKQARKRFAEIASDPSLPDLRRAAAREAIADLDLAEGRVAEAARIYQEVAKLVVSEDHLRALWVKGSPEGPLEREAIVALLVGDRLGPSWDVAAARLGEWSAKQPQDGLADYLLGKNLYLRGRWAEAAQHLDRALARRLASPRVRREALQSRLVVACARGNLSAARRAYWRWRGVPGTNRASWQGMRRLAERCGVVSPG